MIRFWTFAALALALAFGSSVASGTMSAAEAGKCRQTGMLTGKTKTWNCKSGQVCCSAPILGYYGCGTNKLLGCMKM
jgi:hypothetical protein